MKPVLSALTLGVLASLSGCGYLMGDNGFFRDRGSDYQQAEVAPRMTIPADLQTRSIGDLLPVPGQVAAAPAGEDGFETPRPRPMLASADSSAFALQQQGSSRWLVAQLPANEVWPLLALSIAIRCLYSFFLCYAYDNGDLGQVYPIARGTAPLLVAIGAFVIVGESLSFAAFLGIACLVAGVLSLIFDRGSKWKQNQHAIIYALLTALCIAAYTVVDGIGVRNSGSVMGFAAWLTVGDGIFLFLLAVVLRGKSVVRVAKENMAACCVGGLMQAGAYWIIIVALAVAPMAMVSALRETSVLFAAILSTFILKEGMGVWRFISASLITLGMIIMRTDKS